MPPLGMVMLEFWWVS